MRIIILLATILVCAAAISGIAYETKEAKTDCAVEIVANGDSVTATWPCIDHDELVDLVVNMMHNDEDKNKFKELVKDKEVTLSVTTKGRKK